MNIVRFIKNTVLISFLTFATGVSATELPNPEFMGSDGIKHHLKEFIVKGKWTTIVVWGPKCPACLDEMPEIQSIYDDTEINNINVLGLAIDFPSFGYAKLEQVKQFEEDYFISFPNLLISSDLYRGLGLGRMQGTPTLILVNPEGEVSTVNVGSVPRKSIEAYIAKQNTKANTLSDNSVK